MYTMLRQLEVFAEVHKSGSTTQAPQMLALLQSMVSATLIDLEGQLGVQPFNRVDKRLVVNEHRRLLYSCALTLLKRALEIGQLFRGDNGAIRVYANNTIGNYIMPEVIARCRHDFPGLSVELSVSNSLDVINAVADLRIDFDLIEGPCHAADVIAEPRLGDELVMFTAPDSPLLAGEVTLQQLAKVPWILREHGSGTREIVDYVLLSHLPASHMGIELGNSEVIKHVVRRGSDISYLSCRVIAEQLASDTLAELKVPLSRLTRTLWWIRCQQKHISKALQHFLQYCQVQHPVLTPHDGGSLLIIPQVSALLVICGRS